MSSLLVVALVLGFLAISFPFVSYLFRHRPLHAKDGDDNYAELKASILFINTAVPTLLLILGALGFTSFDAIISKVTTEVTEVVNKEVNRARIDSLITRLEALNDEAKRDADEVNLVRISLQDTITMTISSVMNLLPKGTIIPYFGAADGYDSNLWAVCDGKNGTPDLRNRFIYGGSLNQVGQKGGQYQHSHAVSLQFDGKVTKKGTLFYDHYDGGGTKYQVERHDHLFTATKSSGNARNAANLPPYVRLVYLMKKV